MSEGVKHTTSKSILERTFRFERPINEIIGVHKSQHSQVEVAKGHFTHETKSM